MTITKPSKTYSFTPGTGIRSSQTNTNFDDVFDVFEEDAYLAKGWFAIDNASFEYNSANSIKTTSDIDVTGVVQVGDKITFEQATDGEKFFFITAIDYNSTVANRTYIEVYGGTDYDVDNEAITADTIGLSRSQNPYNWPNWFNFEPSFGTSVEGSSLGISSITGNNCRFSIEGSTVHAVYDVVGTTSGTSAYISADLPLPANSVGAPVGAAYGFEAGVTFTGIAEVRSGTQVVRIRKYNNANFSTGPTSIFRFHVTYELA